MQAVARAGASSSTRSSRRSRRELDAALAALPNLPDPTARREDTVLREVGEAGRRPRPRPPRARRRRGSTWRPRRASSGSRFAYLKGDLVHARARARALGAGDARAATGFEPVIPPVLVREQALFGTGFLPDTEQQIYRAAPTTTSTWSAPREVAARLAARRRDPRRGRAAASATPASRRASAARPARRARTRAGSSACTSSTRSRCSAFVAPEDSAGRARAAAGDRGGDPAGRSASPTAWSTSRVDDLGASAAKKYDLRGVAARAGALPRADVDCSNTTDFQARRLDIRYRPEGGRAGDACTRSTAPPWRSGARSSRCWRTASATTARSSLPEAAARLRRARRASPAALISAARWPRRT